MRRLVRKSSIVFLFMIITAGFGYLFRLILSRNMSLAEFGLFFAVLSFINMFYGFKGFGTATASVKFISEYKAKGETEKVREVVLAYSIIQLVIFGMLTLVILFSSGFLSQNYFKAEDAKSLLFILSIAFFFFIFVSTARALLQGLQKQTEFSSVELVQSVLLVLFVYFMHDTSVLIPAFAYLFSFFLTTIWSTYLAARSFPLLGTIKTDLKTYLKLFKYGIPVTLATIFSTLVSSLDTVVLTYFRSLEEVAIYNVAVPTVNLLRYF
ncbi:MAG: oligosaccharide flippase family protein, partial [Nanoarchaeota archaeon]|nr:oligosaccharide flippase family protein [Nanoarchaeota archaeon]